MINASLQIFAENGYNHASTDDIVKNAGISKGLLFHYFESKIGVYEFIYDYCVKFFSLELSSAIDPAEEDYFKLLSQLEAAKMQTMKNYPYMFYFISTCDKETNPEALEVIKDASDKYKEIISEVMSKADTERISANPLKDKYLSMLEYTLNSLVEKNLRLGIFDAEKQYKENVSYIEAINKLF